MTKSLLLLSPFFHPEPIGIGKYNSFLVQSLVRKGVAVDVICFHPLYPDWRPHRSQAELPGVGIHRGGMFLRFPGRNLPRRVVLELGFMVYVLRHARRIRRYSQIVAVLPPMLFLPLIWLFAAPGAKVTAVALDVQGIMAGVVAGDGRGIVVRLVRALEGAVLKCCHRVIALSKGMAAFFADCYAIPPSKIRVCWPFVTLDALPAGRRLSHLFAGDKKHVVYAGALGDKQNPDGLVSFFQKLIMRRGDLVCHVFSGGPMFKSLRQKHADHSNRLIFHDFIPERHLFELFQRSHIQVIPEKLGFSDGAFPSKLPNLLVSGVPILYIGQRDSDVWRMIQRADAGLCADTWDFEVLDALVQRLLLEGVKRSHTERRRQFDRQYAARFDVEVMIKALLD